MSHELVTSDGDDLVVVIEGRVVKEGEENSARRPAELVAERVVGAFGSWETTAVGQELLDLQNA